MDRPNLTASHVHNASLNLRRARHYLGTSQFTAISSHAKLAGQFAAYSGLLYLVWFVRYPDIAAVPAIADAFRDSWFETRDILAGTVVS